MGFFTLVGSAVLTLVFCLYAFGYTPRFTPDEAKQLRSMLRTKVAASRMSEHDKQSELDFIEIAVNKASKKGTREEGLVLLRSAAEHISEWKMKDLSSAMYALMDSSNENSRPVVPTHEQMVIHEAYFNALSALGGNKLQVPRLTPLTPDRRNGDVFYKLLRYAMNNPEDAWVLLSFSIDNRIVEAQQAISMISSLRERGFEELLKDSSRE